ncbi:MAG: DUF4268 domain-containing protein [Flavobacteriales bacterium]|nr:DUF4268 domain-containing protein [Flavobacteriales bacterium]
MYAKEEKKAIKTEFWTSFGVYMRKYTSQYGKVHWVNYKTKIKDLYFRLEFTEQEAFLAIDFQHKDDGIRELFYEQLTELKVVLEEAIGEPLEWTELCFNEFNIPISRVSTKLDGVNLFNKSDWPKVFDFFEKRIVGLHEFWMDFKEIFLNLQK